MEKNILQKVTKLSKEEKEILLHGKNIDLNNYSSSKNFIFNSNKLLNENKQIDLRLHTRFIDFPEHSHDYLEFMYVYCGKITHIINGERLVLKKGDILFMNKNIKHSILKADKEDIGINFIVSNTFLNHIIKNVEQNPVISGFLMRNIDSASEGEYLYFKTADIFPIQNIMDNLIFTLALKEEKNYILTTQLVALLFSYLSFYKETLTSSLKISNPNVIFCNKVQLFIEENYLNASLIKLANEMGYNPEYLSRKIRLLFSKTFKDLVLEERLNIAAKLLESFDLKIEDVINAVGYENKTFFHKLFYKRFGISPYKYKKLHH